MTIPYFKRQKNGEKEPYGKGEKQEKNKMSDVYKI